MTSSVSTFGDLVGQARPAAVLSHAIKRDRVAHAYLFSGPEGVGKSTAARLFVQALTCLRLGEGGRFEGCGQCQSCELIAHGNHPDVWVVTVCPDTEGRARTEISIDQIRKNPDPRKARLSLRPLIPEAYLKPALSSRKVYVIDPADRMSEEAENALLKVLEEPPGDTVLVLVTSQPGALLPTVLSRCQKVGFQLAGTAAIREHLERVGVQPATAALLASLSGGRIAWAIGASERPEIQLSRKRLLDLCAQAEALPVSAALSMAEQIRLEAESLAAQAPDDEEPGSEEEEEEGPVRGKGSRTPDRALRAALPWCLEVIASWYRDQLAVGAGSEILNQDYSEELRKAVGGGRMEAGRVSPLAPGWAGGHPCPPQEAIEAVLEVRQQLARNANIDLALESLAVRLLGGDG